MAHDLPHCWVPGCLLLSNILLCFEFTKISWRLASLQYAAIGGSAKTCVILGDLLIIGMRSLRILVMSGIYIYIYIYMVKAVRAHCNPLDIYIYIYIYIQRITMYPHSYHHNDFMDTPALRTQEVRLHIVWIAL